MLVSLAFLPPCDVETGLEIVRNKLTSTEIIDYFQRTYIRGDVLREIKSTGKIIYKESMFKIEYWSVWHRLETDMDRTNNVQESFHHVLNLIADKQHVGLHQLISILQSVNQKMEHSIATHLTGYK